MAESGLSGAYSEFREKIAFFLGYGRTEGSWNADQISTINSVLKSGLRRFYFPPQLPGQATAHDWSFLHPVTELSIGSTTGTAVGVPVYTTTSALTADASVFQSRMGENGSTTIQFDTSGESYVISSYTSATEVVLTGDASGELSGDTFVISAQYIYDLPDIFGAIDGGFTYNSQNLYDYIKVVSEKQIRDLRQGTRTIGHPQWCAIRPLSATGVTGQRFEVLFYPNPNQSYTLSYAYTPLVDNITSDLPYPWGGMPHTETIIESCLAVAESRVDDGSGEHKQQFMDCLRASVAWDERATTPETLGYNSDRSHEAGANRIYRDNSLVFINQ